MGGPFISSWLRMMFAAIDARKPINLLSWALPEISASSKNGGRGATVAQAKRAALKAKRRRAHRIHCR